MSGGLKLNSHTMIAESYESILVSKRTLLKGPVIDSITGSRIHVESYISL